MSEASPEERLSTLDELYAASNASVGSEELTTLSLKRYDTSVEQYGNFHVKTLLCLSDYAYQLSYSSHYRHSLDLFVDLKKRITEGVHSHHPLYVSALLGMARVYQLDGFHLESTIAFDEATVRARRVFAKKLGGVELVSNFLSVSALRGDSESFERFLLIALEAGTCSLVDAIEKVEGFAKELDEEGVKRLEHLLQKMFEAVQHSDESREEKEKLLAQVKEIGKHSRFISELILRGRLELYRGEEEEHLQQVVDLHSELATFYAEQSDFDLAREHYEIAMSFFNNRAEEESGASSTSKRLGELAYTFGKLEESKALLREALERSLDEAPENAETARLLHNLGTLSIADENFTDAEDYLRNALDLKRLYCGEETAETQLTVIALGVLALKVGKVNDARGYFHEALQIEEELYGTETQQYVSIKGELDKLEGVSEESEEIPLSEQEASDADTEEEPQESTTEIQDIPVEIPDSGFFKASRNGNSSGDGASSAVQEFRSGVLLLHQGKIEDAASLFEGLLEEYPRDTQVKQLVLENLADAYFTLGENEKAKECLAELKSMQREAESRAV